MGARNASLAGATSTISDQWAIFNNPAGIANFKQSAAFVGYQNRFNLAELQTIGGGFVYHHELFGAGAKYYKFGDNYFSQQLIGLTLANRFQMVSLGVGFNIIQTHVETQTTNRVVVLEMGGTAELTKNLWLAAHIFNFKHGEIHPTTMKAGLSFRPKDFLMLNVEFQKQLESESTFKTGLEYFLISSLALRTGIQLQTNSLDEIQINSCFGLGINMKQIQFDYALTSQSLGIIHDISLSYLLPAKQ